MRYTHRVPSAWLMTKPSVEWNPGEFGCARSAPHRPQRVRPGVVGELRYARVGSHGRMSASYKRTAPRVDGDDPDDTPRRNRCVHIGHGTSVETKNPRSRRQRRRRSGTSVRTSLATRPGLWFTPGGTSRGIQCSGRRDTVRELAHPESGRFTSPRTVPQNRRPSFDRQQ